MLLSQHEAGRQTWATSVKKILAKKKKKGFDIVWLSQGAGYEARFIAEFKDRLISSYKQNWYSEVESGNKYRWFDSIKCTFEPKKRKILAAHYK